MKTIPVPEHLPPSAAYALWEWLGHLEHAVWTHYEAALLPLLMAETEDLNYIEPYHEPGDDDDIPFATDPEADLF